MSFVNECDCSILLGQSCNLRKWGDVSIHAEDSVSDDDFEPRILDLDKAFLKIFHVHMEVALAGGFAQANAVNDTCMIQSIRNNSVLWS